MTRNERFDNQTILEICEADKKDLQEEVNHLKDSIKLKNQDIGVLRSKLRSSETQKTELQNFLMSQVSALTAKLNQVSNSEPQPILNNDDISSFVHLNDQDANQEYPPALPSLPTSSTQHPQPQDTIPPPTQPPVSTIQLVPAEGPDSPESGDSGAISDDEEEEVAPPPQEDPNLLPIPRSQSGASSTRSSSPLNIETIEQLEIALAEDGDVKMVMSEELTKTEVYARFMEKYNKDRDGGEETTATFNLKEDKGDNVKPVAERDMEIGNVSPEVVDKYFPGDTSEKEAEAEKAPEVEDENDEK
jgi:hypothetical protein